MLGVFVHHIFLIDLVLKSDVGQNCTCFDENTGLKARTNIACLPVRAFNPLFSWKHAQFWSDSGFRSFEVIPEIVYYPAFFQPFKKIAVYWENVCGSIQHPGCLSRSADLKEKKNSREHLGRVIFDTAHDQIEKWLVKLWNKAILK